MNQEKLTFFKSLKVLSARIFSGRILFSKEYPGKILLMEDGKLQIYKSLRLYALHSSRILKQEK